jgi:large subunit ribosomal protein L25
VTQAAILKDVQRHPAKNQVLHVDLQRVLEDEKIRMSVPLHFTGEGGSPGVKLQGGMASHLLNEVEVTCLPKHLPEFLELDLSAMQIGEIKRLSDIPVQEGVELVELVHGNDEAVVTMHHQRSAEAEAAPEEGAAAAVAPAAAPPAEAPKK